MRKKFMAACLAAILTFGTTIGSSPIKITGTETENATEVISTEVDPVAEKVSAEEEIALEEVPAEEGVSVEEEVATEEISTEEVTTEEVATELEIDTAALECMPEIYPPMPYEIPVIQMVDTSQLQYAYAERDTIQAVLEEQFPGEYTCELEVYGLNFWGGFIYTDLVIQKTYRIGENSSKEQAQQDLDAVYEALADYVLLWDEEEPTVKYNYYYEEHLAYLYDIDFLTYRINYTVDLQLLFDVVAGIQIQDLAENGIDLFLEDEQIIVKVDHDKVSEKTVTSLFGFDCACVDPSIYPSALYGVLEVNGYSFGNKEGTLYDYVRQVSAESVISEFEVGDSIEVQFWGEPIVVTILEAEDEAAEEEEEDDASIATDSTTSTQSASTTTTTQSSLSTTTEGTTQITDVQETTNVIEAVVALIQASEEETTLITEEEVPLSSFNKVSFTFTEETNWSSLATYFSLLDNPTETLEVSVELNGNNVIPEDLLSEIAGKNVLLNLSVAENVYWSIYGKNVPDSGLHEVDLGVELSTDVIPQSLITDIAGDDAVMTVSLDYDGPFGFEATLHLQTDQANTGLYANLFYFNPDLEELEFQKSALIDEDGGFGLMFNHASDYVVVMHVVSMDEQEEQQTMVSSNANQEEDDNHYMSTTTVMTSKAKFYVWLMLPVAGILFACFYIFFIYKGKERARNKKINEDMEE